MRLNRFAQHVLTGYLGLILLFLFAPILASMVFSFNSDRFPTLPLGGFTFDWYDAILTDPLILEAGANTIVVSICSALVSTVLGFLAAYADYRFNFIGKGLTLILALLPPTVPAIILGVAMLGYLSRIGLSGEVYSIILCHVVVCTPFAIALIRLRLSQIDPSLEPAAWNLGANQWAAFRHVILPFTAPVLPAVLFITMAISFDEFAIAWFVGGLHETLPVRVLGFLQGQVSPRINAIGTIFFLVSTALIVSAQVVVSRRISLGRRQ